MVNVSNCHIPIRRLCALLTLDNGHDGALLNGRWTLETIGIDTAEELSLQVHVVEGVDGLIVVRLDLA